MRPSSKREAESTVDFAVKTAKRTLSLKARGFVYPLPRSTDLLQFQRTKESP
jgi:hypothetical protein